MNYAGESIDDDRQIQDKNNKEGISMEYEPEEENLDIETDDFYYDYEGALEDDEITPEEEGFMVGFTG